ncbi:MAG: putative 3-dehydroquinate dehydratase [Fibrobacteres bacterium]|nr:putative 3-dehydroquinate dehydratase [Fibrobacterota bacterium]
MHTIVNLDGIVVESTKNRFGARIIGIVTASNRMDPAIWNELGTCDIAEFRADGFDAERIPGELRSFREESLKRMGRPLETLLTIRLERDGGAWPDADAPAREAVWEALGLDSKDPACDWVDVEIEEFASLSYKARDRFQRGAAKLLLSHHDFRRCRPREGLRALMGEMQSHRPDGMKFAVTCGNRGDLGELIAFTREMAQATPNGCALSMGRIGRVSRVLGPLLGCPFTYGYLTGAAVAPGQLSVRDLAAFYAGIPAESAADLSGKSLESDSEMVDWAEARIPGELLAD